MPFHILYESTTADPIDANENFYFVAQGSRLPMDGVNMGYTDNSLDLGSSAVRWNNLICNNIDTASVTASYAKMPIVLVDYTLVTAATITTFTGFNGDKHGIYKIIIHAAPAGTDSALCVYPFDESVAPSTAVMGGVELIAGATVIFGQAYPYSQYGWYMGSATGASLLAEISFYAKTGNYRPSTFNMVLTSGTDGENIQNIFQTVLVWNNSTKTVTAFALSREDGGAVAAGTRVILMGMDNA